VGFYQGVMAFIRAASVSLNMENARHTSVWPIIPDSDRSSLCCPYLESCEILGVGTEIAFVAGTVATIYCTLTISESNFELQCYNQTQPTATEIRRTTNFVSQLKESVKSRLSSEDVLGLGL